MRKAVGAAGARGKSRGPLQGTSSKASHASIFHIALIAALCLLCYAGTFTVPFQFDDHRFVEANPVIKDLSLFVHPAAAGSMVPDFYARVIGYLTFAANYAFSGTQTAGYHLFNLAIHCLNAVLVYFFIRSLFRTPRLRKSSLQSRASSLALILALLFALHPIQTQAVTYIWQRITALAALFYLFAHLAYVQWRLAGRAKAPEGMQKRFRISPLLWYTGALVSAVLAMLTKEISFTLPFTLALCEGIFFEGKFLKRSYPLIPFMVIMLIIPLEKVVIGGVGADWLEKIALGTRVTSGISRTNYLFTEFRVIVTYCRLMVFPINQNLDYDYPLFTSFAEPAVIGSFLFLCFLGGTGIALLRKSGKFDPATRIVSFGIFWFFITLSVESSIIPIDDLIFEHRMYLPSFGFLAALALLVFGSINKTGVRQKANDTALVVFSVVIALMGASAYVRNKVWQSEISLWTDVVQKSPLKARGYNNLGMAYAREGSAADAMGMFARALELKPDYTDALSNRGMLYVRMGDFRAAIDDLSKALALDPRHANAYNNRAVADISLGNLTAALADLTRAVTLDPRYAEAYCNRGSVFGRMGKITEAVEDLDKALALNPAYPEAHNNRGLAYAAQNRPDLALKEFDEAIALRQGFAEAYVNRGGAYARMGKSDRAVSDFKTACGLGSRQGCEQYKRNALRQPLR